MISDIWQITFAFTKIPSQLLARGRALWVSLRSEGRTATLPSYPRLMQR